MNTFIDDLLAEAEAKELQLEQAHLDLMLKEIAGLESEIEHNFAQADIEAKIIKDWAIIRNEKLQQRIDWIGKKLEAWMREKECKTLDLPNGVLKMHKSPDKVEITDTDLFLQHAKPECLRIIPETVKPDLTKIKAYIKSHFVPKGVNVIPGEVQFKYKLRKEAADAGESKAEAGTAIKRAG